ncbi:ABC-2 type transport system permease protein [Saccharothrix ecbatanensis]|uniref:ABC-2 type transport system permease protein n=1 Tax=Saccharothrix ecbatanensis TaxID=1105145 RepID=A0A7W9HHS3_9PSEU|nr:ABC transporter permease [Saccharothrix ecbatanensis]MBB5802533.1 ABC-2 type transport system permease protein [Saccharothrix ecbatanensis]
MRALFVVSLHELRSRLRDGTAVLITLVAPIALATLFGVALGGDDPPLRTTIAIVDHDGGEFPASVRREALAVPELEDILTFRDYTDENAAQAAIDTGEAGAALVFPAGFTDSVGAGRGGEMQVIESPDTPLAGTIARSIVDRISALVDARTLAAKSVLAAGMPPEQVKAYVEENGARGPTLELAGDPLSGGAVDLAVYYGSGMAVLFAFFVAGSSARSLLTERQLGTLGRIRAAPVPVWTAPAGKAVVGFGLALLSMCATWWSSVLIFGESWGDPVGVFALCLAHTFAATSLVMLVASGAKTDAQADGYTLGIGFVFAFLGGSLVPLYNLPEFLQHAALLTPNGWVASGLTHLASTGEGATSVAGPVAVVAGIGVVAGTLAVYRIRKGLLA